MKKTVWAMAVLSFAYAAAVSAVAGPTTDRKLGPIYPALIDTNGNGRPDPGVDMPLVPTLDGLTGMYFTPNPWDSCGHPQYRTEFGVSNPQVPSGNFMTATGINGRGETVTINATAFDLSGNPTTFSMAFSFTFCVPGPCPPQVPIVIPINSGTGTLLDTNGDGVYDTLQITMTANAFGAIKPSVQVPLTLFDVDGDGKPDYVSIPWAQAAALGVQANTPGCALPTTPQIFLPLSNRHIVIDVNGDNVADPGFFQSPVIAPAQLAGAVVVPTLSQWGIIAMVLALAIIGLSKLRGGGLGF